MTSSKSKTVSVKQLAQLLEEQQEPFTLEVYLSERIYVKKSSSSESNNCKGENSAKDLNRSDSHKVKKKLVNPYGSKILKLAINNLISYRNCQKLEHRIYKAQKDRGKQASRIAKKQQNDAVKNWLSSSSSITLLHSSSKGNAEVQWGYMEDSKQLSPIMVREELLPDEVGDFLRAKQEETTFVPNYSVPRKAKDSTLSAYLWELLVQSPSKKQNCVSKTKLHTKSGSPQYLKPKRVSMQAKQLLFNCVKEAIDTPGRQRSNREVLRPEESRKVNCDLIRLWRNRYRDVKIVNQLIDLEFSNTIDWRNFQLLSEDIGIAIADAILDGIVTETIKLR